MDRRGWIIFGSIFSVVALTIGLGVGLGLGLKEDTSNEDINYPSFEIRGLSNSEDPDLTDPNDLTELAPPNEMTYPQLVPNKGSIQTVANSNNLTNYTIKAEDITYGLLEEVQGIPPVEGAFMNIVKDTMLELIINIQDLEGTTYDVIYANSNSLIKQLIQVNNFTPEPGPDIAYLLSREIEAFEIDLSSTVEDNPNLSDEEKINYRQFSNYSYSFLNNSATITPIQIQPIIYNYEIDYMENEFNPTTSNMYSSRGIYEASLEILQYDYGVTEFENLSGLYNEIEIDHFVVKHNKTSDQTCSSGFEFEYSISLTYSYGDSPENLTEVDLKLEAESDQNAIDCAPSAPQDFAEVNIFPTASRESRE